MMPEPTHNPPDDDGALAAREGQRFEPDGLDFVLDVQVRLSVEIGRRSMRIAELLRLGPGSVLELNKVSGEPLDIYAGERLVARGEAVVVGERYGVRLTEVVIDTPHGGSLEDLL